MNHTERRSNPTSPRAAFHRLPVTPHVDTTSEGKRERLIDLMAQLSVCHEASRRAAEELQKATVELIAETDMRIMDREKIISQMRGAV